MPNEADLNSRMSTIGESTCSSMKQNATSSSKPIPMAPSTIGLVQPVEWSP